MSPPDKGEKNKLDKEKRIAALQLENGELVRGRWKVIRKLGQGGFGAVYEVDDNVTNVRAALKVEANWIPAQLLRMEIAVLQKCSSSSHIADLVGAGRLPPDKNFLVMQLLGMNLSSKRRQLPNKRAHPATTIRIGLQCLFGIRDMHAGGFVHRDVKPSNFALGVFGTKYERIVYLLDFGLARQYMQSNGTLRPARKKAGFRGTVRYASIAAHDKIELGRHDDLWSMMYMLIEYVTGDLPWRRNLEKEEAGEAKRKVKLEKLSENCPKCFPKILLHLKHLDYDHAPDYKLVEERFRTTMQEKGYKENDPYDWEPGGAEHQFTRKMDQESEAHLRESTFAIDDVEGDLDPTN